MRQQIINLRKSDMEEPRIHNENFLKKHIAEHGEGNATEFKEHDDSSVVDAYSANSALYEHMEKNGSIENTLKKNIDLLDAQISFYSEQMEALDNYLDAYVPAKANVSLESANVNEEIIDEIRSRGTASEIVANEERAKLREHRHWQEGMMLKKKEEKAAVEALLHKFLSNVNHPINPNHN